MTTYLRAFSADSLQRAQDATYGQAFYELAHADLKRTVRGEDIAMPIVCTGWNARASGLGLTTKGVKRDTDREAYMQGALAAMVALGVMTVERANQIGFLCMVGRLDEYVADQAAKDAP